MHLSQLKRKVTLNVKPHICDTSNIAALVRQFLTESIMESLYWIGIDQPAKGTILPAAHSRG